VPLEVVVKRIRRKKAVMERLETQRRVRDVYMKFVENGRLVPINGNRTKDEVARDILAVALDFLKNYKDFQSV